MFTISNLDYFIEEKKILNNISFSIPEGKVTAIVGPNGVGKTTTVQILSNIIENKNPSITEITKNKKVIYLDLEYLIFEELTAKEYIDLICSYNNKNPKELYQLLDEFEPLNIQSFLSTKLKGLSLGQKQKLLILTGFLSNADILIFDEPFNGLDYKSEQIFKHLLKDNRYKFTILITTHNFLDIEKYTEKCIIMRDNSTIIQVINDNQEKYKSSIFKHLEFEDEFSY